MSQEMEIDLVKYLRNLEDLKSVIKYAKIDSKSCTEVAQVIITEFL